MKSGPKALSPPQGHRSHTGHGQTTFSRRGRGILVVPGFRRAARSLVGAKTTGQFFFKF